LCSFHRLFELSHLAAVNQVLHARAPEKNLDRCNTTSIILAHEALTDDGAQIQAELEIDLAVLVEWKEVHYPLHRLIGVVGVQRGKTEMPRFGKRNCRLHRLRVANLSDKNDIRRLTERIF